MQETDRTKHRTTRPASGIAALLLTLATAATLSAQTATAPAPAAAPAATDETIQLSPFTVSTDKDYGYRASNSIAGTRTNTPIKDIPMNIQVFTKDLAEDMLITNQVDFERYNASLVNGGADRFSDNPIQQTYQAFLFRGFRQNWGLRDGIREYDPVDTQNLARVEVVKGPAAALYGLAYPGGVMNNITKSVDFTHNFANLRLTAGDQSDYRASVDANFAGEALNGNKFGIRFNGVNARSEDTREHSKGKVQLSSVEFEWRPTSSTQAEFMMEHGYRAKPNGLQYFSIGTPASEAGSAADVPLQVARPNIPWDWNWSNGKDFRSLETHLYRGTITQGIGENFQVRAYTQFSSRLNIDGNGWDANGSGGADSWESAGSGMDIANNTITETYHYRDWGNEMHAYGATGVYKLNVADTKNTFAFGANVWAEKELSRASRPLNPLASAVVLPIQANIPITIPNFPPSDLVPESDGGPNGNGYHHENNSNDYYFANWQMYAFHDRLKTNIGVNKTNMKLLTWNNGASQTIDNAYNASKVSPLYGVVFDITKEISVFGLRSTSLFPDSTKDSFGHQFSPQSGSSWEGGVKVELMDGKLSGTVSYFDIEQTGGTQSAPNHENLNTATWDRLTPAERAVQFPGKTRADLFAAGDIIAGGKQESKGVDVDLVYQPTRELQFVFSYEHVKHQFVTSALPATIGETYPGAQKDRYALLSRYSFRDGALKNLTVGLGITGGSKALVDYQTRNGVDVARYEPARMVAEAFASYHVKLLNQNTVWQLNVQNITKTPDYVGWKTTGSSTVLATERYKVPTPVRFQLTFGLDF